MRPPQTEHAGAIIGESGRKLRGAELSEQYQALWPWPVLISWQDCLGSPLSRQLGSLLISLPCRESLNVEEEARWVGSETRKDLWGVAL